MKNRYIPFGYQIQNGDSVINTEQAATVQHIFYAYTEGQSFKEIAEYLTTSGTAYHFSDNSWNKNIVARILANEIYCGAKGYPAIISKEVYSQAASIRSNKTVTYSAVLKPFRSDMQCACCGERLYWRPRTQQWTCRQCGMWSKPMQPENMAQQIVDRLLTLYRAIHSYHQELYGQHGGCNFYHCAVDHQPGAVWHYGPGVYQRVGQRPVHLYPVRAPVAAAGGHHAADGAGDQPVHHLYLPAPQPLPTGVPLPA